MGSRTIEIAVGRPQQPSPHHIGGVSGKEVVKHGVVSLWINFIDQSAADGRITCRIAAEHGHPVDISHGIHNRPRLWTTAIGTPVKGVQYRKRTSDIQSEDDAAAVAVALKIATNFGRSVEIASGIEKQIGKRVFTAHILEAVQAPLYRSSDSATAPQP